MSEPETYEDILTNIASSLQELVYRIQDAVKERVQWEDRQ